MSANLFWCKFDFNLLNELPHPLPMAYVSFDALYNVT